MAQKNVMLFGDPAGTIPADTSNTPGSLVIRDPADGSVPIGPLTTNKITNTGTETDTPGASTAAAGSTTTDAGVLPAGTSKIYPTTAADGTKGVRVHVSDKVTGRMFIVGNGVSNQVLKIYPPSGGTINGAAADAAYSTASGKGALIVCLDGSGNTWGALG